MPCWATTIRVSTPFWLRYENISCKWVVRNRSSGMALRYPFKLSMTPIFDGASDLVGEHARGLLGRVHLLHVQQPLRHVCPQAARLAQAQFVDPLDQDVKHLVEHVDRRIVSGLHGGHGELHGDRRLAHSG